MIKLFTLFVVLHNPVTDVDMTTVQGVYEEHACYAMENVLNESNSALNIELKNKNIELVETHCDVQ